jgi:hypothetical protein
MIAGPDFICIGLPKAATGWLYDQLQFHPDFWMPPIKELGYLNHETVRFKSSEKRLSRLEKGEVRQKKNPERLKRKDLAELRPRVDLDARFLRMASTLRGQERNLKRYIELFDIKGEFLSGDITPGYCRLEEDMIVQIAEHLPQAKILLLVRDPVARTWSDMSMVHRKHNFDASLLDDIQAFRAYLETTQRYKITSSPSTVWERWKKHAPQLQKRYFLLDDIAAEPAKVLRDILLYLGADADKQGQQIAADYNRKSVRRKLEMSDAISTALAEHFASELRACAETFGGRAEHWPSKYGV